MLLTMASDLGVQRYDSETDSQFQNRVLYSAMACWIKTVSIDRSIYTSDPACIGVSRQHIHDQCVSIWQQFSNRYPQCHAWFCPPEVKNHPVDIIRSRLIAHGELINAGFQTNLALSKSTQIQVTQDMKCSKGVLLQSDHHYSGIATLCNAGQEMDFSAQPQPSAMEWMKQYMRAVRWIKIHRLDEHLDYYAPYKNRDSWTTTVLQSVSQVVLLRKRCTHAQNEYYLYKPGQQMLHTMDPFLVEQWEYRRVMAGIRLLAGMPVCLKVIRYADHVFFKLPIYLPARELRFLQTYAWPHNHIEDPLEWDMSSTVWDGMKPQLVQLGYEITEEQHG